jgi:hypothetical protein
MKYPSCVAQLRQTYGKVLSFCFLFRSFLPQELPTLKIKYYRVSNVVGIYFSIRRALKNEALTATQVYQLISVPTLLYKEKHGFGEHKTK